jgi:SNF2 family DNA or RNA helicase
MPIELREHQRAAVEIGRQKPRYAFFWKPGTGKTIGALGIIRERPMRTLVIAPKAVIPTAWVPDGEGMGVPVVVARHHDKRKRLALIRTPGDIVLVTNFEQFKIHAQDFLNTGVQRLIVDESSKLKNHESGISKAVHAFSDKVREVYLLTGTPAPNCRTELWSQLRALSPVASGPSFFSWAHRWFVPVYSKVWRKTSGGGSRQIQVLDRWVPKPELEQQFIDSLKPWCQYLSKESCTDLPAKTSVVRLVELDEPELKAYASLATTLKVEVTGAGPTDAGHIQFKAEAAAMKMRQVTSGFLLIGDHAQHLGTSKIDALDEVLEDIGLDAPVIVWCEFRESIDRLERHFKEQGIACGILDGRTKDPGPIIADFIAGKIRRILAVPSAVGHGTNGLQKVCQYAVYYELNYSAENHEQSQDRIHRSGQKWPCTYIYLIAPETTDEGLLNCVQGKMTKQAALLQLVKA